MVGVLVLGPLEQFLAQIGRFLGRGTSLGVVLLVDEALRLIDLRGGLLIQVLRKTLGLISLGLLHALVGAFEGEIGQHLVAAQGGTEQQAKGKSSRQAAQRQRVHHNKAPPDGDS